MGRINTRFSEFLSASSEDPKWKLAFTSSERRCGVARKCHLGVLSKGVWWMPRLKKATKDAA